MQANSILERRKKQKPIPLKKILLFHGMLCLMSFNCLFQYILSEQLYYRPQRSCGQGNIFTPVCHSFCSRGGSASVHAGIPPPLDQADLPRPGRPPGTRQTPQGADPPRTRQTPLTRQTPPRPCRPPHPPYKADTPPREADSSIRSTSGRYASYWNAYLFIYKCLYCCELPHLSGVALKIWPLFETVSRMKKICDLYAFSSLHAVLSSGNLYFNT